MIRCSKCKCKKVIEGGLKTCEKCRIKQKEYISKQMSLTLDGRRFCRICKNIKPNEEFNACLHTCQKCRTRQNEYKANKRREKREAKPPKEITPDMTQCPLCKTPLLHLSHHLKTQKHLKVCQELQSTVKIVWRDNQGLLIIEPFNKNLV